MIESQSQTDFLSRALPLAARGWAVFPLGAGRKTPQADSRGIYDALHGADAVKARWGSTVEAAANVGIATGTPSGLVVLDVDCKGKRDGFSALDELELLHGLPETLTVRTPSGGMHLYFVADTAYACSVDKVAPGLDIRADGGYVVGPGSRTVDGGYVIEHDADPAPLPDWLAEQMTRPRERATGADAVWADAVEHLDSPRTVEDVKAYLARSAPEAVEGAGGNATTYRVACECRDRGATELTALTLMADHWNPEKAIPPWDYDDLADVVANAYCYAREPQGARNLEGAFGVVEDASGETQAPGAGETPSERFPLRRAADARLPDKAPHLIKGLIDKGSLGILYGESNSGKTFVALEMAWCIAIGRPFLGMDVERGLVVYLSLEGGRSFDKRVLAQIAAHGADIDDNFWFITVPARLVGTDNDTEALAQSIATTLGARRRDLRAIVVDTLSRAIAGENENAPDVMTSFVGQVDRLRVALDCTALVVHHTGKDRARGARGHSSLRAATDTELELSVRDETRSERILRVTKQRDMEAAGPWAVDLRAVTVGHDDDGTAVQSCVLTGWGDDGRDDAADVFDVVALERQEALDALPGLTRLVAGAVIGLGAGEHDRDACWSAIEAAHAAAGSPYSTIAHPKEGPRRAFEALREAGTADEKLGLTFLVSRAGRLRQIRVSQ